MLKSYYRTVKYYRKGEYKGRSTTNKIIRPELPENCQERIEYLEWKNLEEKFQQLEDFGYEMTKKGRIFRFNHFNANMTIKEEFFGIREWEENLNIKIVYTYEPCSVTLKELLEDFNAEVAAQYMQDHNIKLS